MDLLPGRGSREGRSVADVVPRGLAFLVVVDVFLLWEVRVLPGYAFGICAKLSGLLSIGDSVIELNDNKHLPSAKGPINLSATRPVGTHLNYGCRL